MGTVGVSNPHVRLQEGSLTELVVRNVAPAIEIEASRDIVVTKVGGRLLGRYLVQHGIRGR